MPEEDRPGRQAAATAASEPREQAAELLEQADRLMQLSRELRQQARRLNAALGEPGSRTETGEPEGAIPGGRFAPSGEQPSAGSEAEEGGDPRLSYGARLLITNMALGGSSREEILTVMRDELGLAHPEAILDRLSI
jgi:hypothetical protein